MSNPANPSIGSSDTSVVQVDFDDVELDVVTSWARKALRRFRLRGFIILESSPRCYHVVFDRTVTWIENLRILAWISVLSRCEKLQTYTLMQCIKQSSTLRVSTKSGKPAPRIVYRYGRQDTEIPRFLQHRRLIKRILRERNRVA